MERHYNLDSKPVSENVLYINKPKLIDTTIIDTALQETSKKVLMEFIRAVY